MECEDGLWRPVAFLSKSLNKTERNYEIYDKEMLAVIRGLEVWRHLLEGVQSKFEIWTDHKNLDCTPSSKCLHASNSLMTASIFLSYIS